MIETILSVAYSGPSGRFMPSMPKKTRGAVYLILGWAPSSNHKNPVSSAAPGAGACGATVRIVRVVGPFLALPKQRHAGDWDHGERWAFSFLDGRQDDAAAMKIADGLDGLSHLVYPVGGRIAVYRIPAAFIRGGHVVRGEDVVKEDAGREDSWGELELFSAFSSAVQIPAAAADEIWRLLPACSDDRILDALTFYRTSVSQVSFSPGDIYDILSFRQADDVPTSAVVQAAYDSAFQDGFKALEAILGGEPSKNEQKRGTQLTAAGLDPDHSLGVCRKLTLVEWVRAFHDIRDARTGHGRRRRKQPITKGELIDLHNCAYYAILSAANGLLVSQEGEAL